MKSDCCPKVSFIMGIYNCQDTLTQAIDSVVNQTYKNWELVMCDDASTDATHEIAKRYCERYPEKIILLQNEKNMRLAASLNRCLERANGDYIARMDADDENMPTRLEKQVEYLQTHPEIACVGSGTIVYDEFCEYGERYGSEFPDKNSLLRGTPFAHPTIMMKKSVYLQLSGYTVSEDTMRAEDLDLWFRFYQAGFQGYVIQEPLYKYRESLNDFKKRTLKAAIGTTKVYLRGYKMLHFSRRNYLYAFKPIISAIVPNRIMRYYHQRNLKKRSVVG